MNLENLLSHYPRIKQVDPKNQKDLFQILDQVPLSSDQLQISFDRNPDFFRYMKIQGEWGYAFYFVNKDQSPQGMAVSTFRLMQWNQKPICLGYTSDLRTTSKMDRGARLEWRKFYAQAVSQCHEIEEFKNCAGFFTAVWDENNLAQKALVEKKRPHDFSYQATTTYKSYALWGRWNPIYQPPKSIRKVRPNEIAMILESLCKSSALSWNTDDLLRTLNSLNQSLSDFYVLEENGLIRSFVLPASTGHLKKTRIKKWPKTLKWASKLLPLFNKRPIELHDEIEIMQLMFYRSFKNDPFDLYEFADYFWFKNSKNSLDHQFHLLTIGAWTPLNFVKKGYLVSTLSGTLYKVISDSISSEFQNINDFSNLEIGLL